MEKEKGGGALHLPSFCALDLPSLYRCQKKNLPPYIGTHTTTLYFAGIIPATFIAATNIARLLPGSGSLPESAVFSGPHWAMGIWGATCRIPSIPLVLLNSPA